MTYNEYGETDLMPWFGGYDVPVVPVGTTPVLIGSLCAPVPRLTWDVVEADTDLDDTGDDCDFDTMGRFLVLRSLKGMPVEREYRPGRLLDMIGPVSVSITLNAHSNTPAFEGDVIIESLERIIEHIRGGGLLPQIMQEGE